MPLDLAKEQANLDALRAFWQPILRLADWDIQATIDPSIVPNLGLCLADHVYRRADIRVAPASTPGQDVEASLVHELIHPHFAAFETEGGSAERNEEERAVESLMRAVIDLKRKGVSTDAVARLARRAFDACGRKRIVARGGRQERHRMPDSSVLAALAIKAGQLMAQEGMPEEAKALFQEFLEAMAGGGGDEPQQSQNEPAPMRDPEAQPDKPGEGQKPPMRAAADNELGARLRALEAKAEADEKARKASDEKRRTALLTEAAPRIPEAQAGFAARLSLDQLEAYVATLPARGPVDRGQRALRGNGARSGDEESRARLRVAMGIVSKDVDLPHRDAEGRKVWPVNGPSALRRALSGGDQ